MYKRDRFVFVSNLGSITCHADYPETFSRDAYLLSAHYSSKRLVKLAKTARSRRNLIFSDNGNFSLMKKVARGFLDQSRLLIDDIKQSRKQGAGFTTALKKRYSTLWDAIELRCQQAMLDQNKSDILSTQKLANPHLMIGFEDITIAVLSICGLLDESLDVQYAQIKKHHENNLSIHANQLAGDYGEIETANSVFYVIHSYDYHSAHQGALLARRNTEVSSLAVSYGAPMQSRKWRDTFIGSNNKTITLEKKVPESYVLAQLQTRAVLDAYKGKKPRLHILGSGSPIMMVLSALFVSETNGLSVDSSAPLKDAFDGRIYGSRAAYMKMKRLKLAAILLLQEDAYASKNIFFKAFEKHHPADWPGLYKQLQLHSGMTSREVIKLLEKNEDLVKKYIPFFAIIKGTKDPFYLDLAIARTGTNFAVLQEITERIKRRIDHPEKMISWVEKELLRYKNAANKHWARATEVAYALSIR